MEKEQAEIELRKALNILSEQFIDGVRTETERSALDNLGDVDSMSEEEFSNLLAARMSILDEEERREASKAIARKIACWRGGEDNPLSLREEILIELQPDLFIQGNIFLPSRLLQYGVDHLLQFFVLYVPCHIKP